MNHANINQLAAAVHNTTGLQQERIIEDLLTELKPWVKRQANKAYATMQKYNGDFHTTYGYIEDGILRWILKNDAHESYDISKGYFVGFIHGHVRNELKKYKSKLMVDTRNISHEAYSLNDSPSDDSENTYGELTASGFDEDFFNADVTLLLKEFAATVLDGQAKAQALFMVLNSHMYEPLDIAIALGYTENSAPARKKLQRTKEEFRKFMSQTN